MASWRQLENEAPEFATRVRAVFDAGTNKTIATLRSDGSPRISGIELAFADGEATFGSMGGSAKLADIRRDPRVAIHSPTLEPPPDDPSAWSGDAKLSGVAVPIATPPENPDPNGGFFRLDITEAVLTHVGTPADHLVIESWHPGRGWQKRMRR
jgi:pyridoxamine 5'-phosphate oxidase-like protein